jgi:hypothetical protein
VNRARAITRQEQTSNSLLKGKGKNKILFILICFLYFYWLSIKSINEAKKRKVIPFIFWLLKSMMRKVRKQ